MGREACQPMRSPPQYKETARLAGRFYSPHWAGSWREVPTSSTARTSCKVQGVPDNDPNGLLGSLPGGDSERSPSGLCPLRTKVNQGRASRSPAHGTCPKGYGNFHNYESRTSRQRDGKQRTSVLVDHDELLQASKGLDEADRIDGY